MLLSTSRLNVTQLTWALATALDIPFYAADCRDARSTLCWPGQGTINRQQSSRPVVLLSSDGLTLEHHGVSVPLHSPDHNVLFDLILDTGKVTNLSLGVDRQWTARCGEVKYTSKDSNYRTAVVWAFVKARYGEKINIPDSLCNVSD